MSLILFLIILSALVIVHELGHLSVAKFFGIRVDEFGLGYPPRAKKLFRWKGTDFTLNWLPFGGFVKIFGESYEDLAVGPPSDSFQYKNRGIQASVLVAGVVGNFLFAWVLLSLGFISGLPAPVGANLPVENIETVITTVVPDSPAFQAGIKSGDTLVSINGISLFPEAAADYIAHYDSKLNFKIKRGEEILTKEVVPAEGIVAGQKAVGISMESLGIVKLPFFRAFFEGWKTTWALTVATAEALGQFVSDAVVGKADLSTVTGPVGLVGMVGEVGALGFSHLLAFTALISINLSIINLLPFPALDGGRLLFVGIESVTRRRISPRIFNTLNTAGFALLIFLMILVTIHDVKNVF